MARMKNHFEFTAGVYFNDELFFNKYNLMVDFFSLGDTSENQNIALDRMTYFIYDVMQRSIFVREGDRPAIKNFTNAGIPVLTLPDPAPADPVVLGAIATKMNAIMGDVLIVSDAELSSYVGSGIIYVWDSADEDDDVHKIINSEDDTKWWCVSDPRFTSYEEGTDVAALEKTNPFPMTWDLLDLEWIPEDGDVPGKKKGTIIKANFTGK